MKIRSQIMLYIAVIGVLPLFLAGIVAYKYSKSRLLAQSDRNLISLTGQVATQVDSFLDHAVENARIVALSPRLAAFAQGLQLPPLYPRPTTGPIDDPMSKQRRDMQVSQFLQSTVGQNPSYSVSCALFSAQGEKLLDTSADSQTPNEGAASWVRIPLSENRTYVLADLDKPKHQSLYVSAPIPGPDGKPVGVLRLRYALSALQAIVTSLNTPNTPFALITDKAGRILAQGENAQLIGESAPYSALESETNPPRGKIQLYWGQASFESQKKNTHDRLAFSALEHAPWTLACVAPPAYYHETTRELFRTMVGLGALVLLFSTILGFYVASRLSRPITKLAAIAEKIGQGQPLPDIPVDDSGEIGTLARTLKRTTEQLHLSHQTLQARIADLHRSEERFRQLVENSSELILQISPDGRILYASPNHASITGHAPESIENTSLLDLLHPDDRLHATHLFRQPRIQSTLRFRYGDGTWRGLEFSGRRYHVIDPSSARPVDHLVVLARDRTEHDKAEETRHQLEQQLYQAQKLDAIGTLASGIAHDFNNLLTGIMGNIEVANDLLVPTEPARPMLADALAASRRARDVVSRLLTFSRRRETKFTRVELEGVILEALSLLRASIPASIKIKTQFEPNLPPISCDPTQIHQIIMNLGANAAHAMRANGGTLTIRLYRLEPLAPHQGSRAQIARHPYDLRLTVRDTGTGMDADTLARIFEPFFTTKPVGEGTGLGLSVVHGIVRTLRGNIHAESTPGSGTAFHLDFTSAPVNNDNALLPRPNTAQPIAIPRGNGQHILIVDDEPAVLRATERSLDRLGYKITAFSSPTSLLEFISIRSQFDALITDYVMPEMHGLELSRRIRITHPDKPMMVITGNPEAVDLHTVQKLNIAHIITKPYTLEVLGSTLHDMLRQHAASSLPNS